MACVAERVLVGEGNRLGRGPRAARYDAGRQAARDTNRGANDNPRHERVATYVLRLGELDRKAGRVKHLALTAIWLREVADQHAQLARVSRKTMRLDRLAEYHAVSSSVADALWANRSKARVSRAAFGYWSRSTAAMDAFWARFARGRACDGTTGREGSTYLGYGDAAVGGRAPTVRMRQSAERVLARGRVVLLDEFLTSATCHTCGDRVQGVVDRHKNKTKGLPPSAVDRGHKHCARSTCSCFLDRDVNVRWGGAGSAEGAWGRARARAVLTPRNPPLPRAGCSKHPQTSHRMAPRGAATTSSAARLRPEVPRAKYHRAGTRGYGQYAARG